MYKTMPWEMQDITNPIPAAQTLIKTNITQSPYGVSSLSESESECYCAYHQELVIWHRKSQQSIYE